MHKYKLPTRIMYTHNSFEQKYKIFCAKTKIESFMKEKGEIIGIIPRIDRNKYLYYKIESLNEVNSNK